MKSRIGLIGAFLVISPLFFLYIYKHDQHSDPKHHNRAHIVMDYLHHDSATAWGQIVKYKQANQLSTTKNKSHFEYEFMLKSKKYRGLVYEAELHHDNHQHLGVNDSIRILYSQSDPFLNIPHIIADDLHQMNQ